MAKSNNETASVDVILNGQKANATLKEIKAAARAVNAELSKLPVNSAEFTKKAEEWNTINDRISNIKQQIYGTSKAIQESTEKTSAWQKVLQIASGVGLWDIAKNVFSKIVSGVKSSIEAYREQERAVQKVEQSIRQTGGAAGLSLKQLTDEATKLQEKTLFGDEEILNKSTAQLLTFTSITGENFLKAQRSAMDLSTVLDGDLQGATLQLGKALQNPLTGLTALRRSGVSFTEEQKKLIAELTNTNRLEEAQAMILEEVNRQYGGQAEAVAKGTGAIEQAGIQIGEIFETIGGIAGKIIAPFAVAVGNLAKKFNELISSSKTAVELFDEQSKTVGVLVTEINPLLDRYDQLKSKTSLNAIEQAELKKIIGQVTATMPGAATAFDNYGNAIAISTDRVRQYIKGQILLLRYENRKAIDETISDLADVNSAVSRAKGQMDQIAKTGTFPVFEPKSNMGAKTGGTIDDIRNANQQEIAEAQRKYQELVNTQTALNTKLGNLRADALQQSLAAYEAEKNASRNTANSTVNYKTMSMEELKDLADDGNEIQKRAANEEIKRRETINKSLTKLQKDLEDAKVQIVQDEHERELKLLELNYQRKLTEIKGNGRAENELRQLLAEQYNSDAEKINEKYRKNELDKTLDLETQKWQAKIKSVKEGSLQWFNYQSEFLRVSMERELKTVELTEQQKQQIEEKYSSLRLQSNVRPNDNSMFDKFDQRFEDEWQKEKMYLERTGGMTIEKRKEIAAQERDIQLSAASDNAQRRALIEEEYLTKIKDLNIEHINTIYERLQSAFNSISQLTEAVMSSQSVKYQDDLHVFEESLEKKRKILDKDLKNGLISQDEYDQEIIKLDTELAEERRRIAVEQAESEMAITMLMVTLQQGIAIASAISLAAKSSMTPLDLALNIIAAVAIVAGAFITATNKIDEAKAMQYSKGKYNVIGMEDGRRYRNVPYLGTPETGIYKNPALISEEGPELIVSAPDVKNMQLNYPGLLDAINFARVRQFASGKYPAQAASSQTQLVQQLPIDLEKLTMALELFNNMARSGIIAKVVYSEYEEMRVKIEHIESNVSSE